MKQQFQRLAQRMINLGMRLSAPVDGFASDFKWAILRNIRSYETGVMETRKGTTAFNATAIGGGTPQAIHSLRRLNNDLPGASNAFARVVGAGTELYTDDAAHTSYVSRDTGYSGAPLCFVPHRPPRSVESWMYVADTNKMRKIKADGTDYQQGIAPLNSAPGIALAAPNYKVISAFESVGAWANAGTAGAVSAVARINTTITRILFDSGSTGWASIQPAAMTEVIQPGVLLIIDSAGTPETVLVHSVYKAIASTQVASIQYDTGSTGLCTIALSTPSPDLTQDSLLLLGSGGTQEAVRVLSVATGRDGLVSFRCSTANTQAASGAVAGLATFRTHCTATHSATQTLTGNSLQSSVTTGTGYITLAGALDLSNVGNRPLSDLDDMHVSVKIDNLANLSFGQILLDFDAATNDFTRNFYVREFRANDLAPVAAQSMSAITAMQRALQRQLIEGEAAASEQTVAGNNQWSEIKFKLGELLKVGSDNSRGLKDVASVRILLVTTGTVVLNVDSWWVGGTYGPDVSPTGDPYRYCVVAHSKATGAVSNASPETRGALYSYRSRNTVTPAQHADAQVDELWIYRVGGTLSTWRRVGVCPNSATPSFTDDIADTTAQNFPILELDNFQPFPSMDVPRSGVCSVVGTSVVSVSGDSFNTAWSPDTQILIDGVAYSLYARPSSDQRLEIKESAGTKTSVNWSIPQATVLGQALPIMFGPLGGGADGVTAFAVGDPRAPGTLYWLKKNNFDSSSPTRTLEITPPSEPLMNGAVLDGRAFVISSERIFAIYPDSAGGFVANDVPNSKGLFARYAIAAGARIYFLANDGIYEFDGAAVRSITDTDLYPLFPHSGQAAQAINGINPPDFTQTNALRLSFGDGLVYFDFIDTAAARRTLVYDTRTEAWVSVDAYAAGGTLHYFEEGRGLHSLLVGGADGRVYQMTGTTDGGTAVACVIRSPSLDFGDSNAHKLIGDIRVDCNPGGVTVTATPGYNNHASTTAAASLTGGSRAQKTVELAAGAGLTAQDVSLELTWSGAGPKIYEWAPSFVAKAEETGKRATDWETFDAARFVQGVWLEADTGGLARTVEVQYDGATVGETLTVNHNGQLLKEYAFDPAFIARQVRIVPTDSNSWKLYSWRWVTEPEPPLADTWVTQETTFDLPDYAQAADMMVAHRSTANISLVLTVDGVDSAPYPIPHGAGAYRKDRVILAANKGKHYRFKFTSTAGFRLYLRDIDVRVKAVGSPGPYLTVRPFGDFSREQGAAI